MFRAKCYTWIKQTGLSKHSLQGLEDWIKKLQQFSILLFLQTCSEQQVQKDANRRKLWD